jgi:hypothetical protein
VPLDRPPRPPTGAVTQAVRGAILRRAHEDLGLTAPRVISLHTEADHLADTRALFDDVERRYGLKAGTMNMRVLRRIVAAAGLGVLKGEGPVGVMVYDDRGAGFVLLELPDSEFLTAIENAVQLGYEKRLFGGENFSGHDEAYPLAENFLAYNDEALAAHGAPYRRIVDQWRFEWIGDPKEHALTVEPALLALADPRLGGPQAEFEEALRKRRLGAPKDLEDAVDEAAKAVESVLKVLHDEHGVTPPRSQQVTPLFNSLVAADVIPGYVDKLIAAASGPRNHMASHGQGATVREVPEELAEASIAAAAVAITFLARYLP